jgi:hypothetical protein
MGYIVGWCNGMACNAFNGLFWIGRKLQCFDGFAGCTRGNGGSCWLGVWREEDGSLRCQLAWLDVVMETRSCRRAFRQTRKTGEAIYPLL